MEAGRPSCIGATLYTTHFPCQLCTRKIICCGIKRIVYYKFYDSPLSREMLSQTDIEICRLRPDDGVLHIEKRSMENALGSPEKINAPHELESPSLKRQKTMSEIEKDSKV